MHDLKERIRRENPIIEVIGEKVPLKPSGRNFVALCPLHSDQNNPNLNVYPETESFYCFACGKGGDVFNFVMESEGIPFNEAARILASRKNIPFSFNGSGYEADDKRRHNETVLTEAAHLYHASMIPEIVDYLKGRGITEETIEKFKIGYCSGVTPYQSSKESLLSAGIIYESGGEFFRGFITFPHFSRGQVVFISGRGFPEKAHKKLPKEKVPLVQPFNDAAVRQDVVIIAEGEIDTLTLLQNGFNACGVLGANSFRPEWVDRFAHCKRVYLSFDNDEAGTKANLEIAKMFGTKARLVFLPEGEDVNDFFRHGSREDYQQLLDQAPSRLEYLIKKIPSTTSRMELPDLLRPILEEMAELDDAAYVDALLRSCIKDNFKLKGKELESYEDVLKDLKKASKEDEAPAFATSSDLMNTLKQGGEERAISPAQDFEGGVMHFTVLIQQTPCLVNSKRKLLTFAEAAENGLVLKTEEVSLSRFSRAGIVGFLETKREVNIPELYGRIRDYIKRFIFFADQRCVVYLTLWVMGTYLFTVFRYYPYVWLNAEKGSGKTLLMEILSSIAFNGELVTNPTEATLFRDVANNMTSIFIDEVEKLRKRDKDTFGAIISLLNVGFSKSGLVKRAESTRSGKFIIKSYPAYSPKMFAGINEIDDVLQDRTVCLRLWKKKENETAERYKETEELLALQRSIRDDLYIFALTCAEQIAAIYHAGDDLIQGIGHLSNRELDIWEPIFILANIVDGLSKTSEVTGVMESLSKDAIKERQADNVDKNETYQLLTVMKNMLEVEPTLENSDGILVFDSDGVLKYFKGTDEFSWLEKKNALTTRLKKIAVRSEQRRHNDGKVRVYIVDQKKLDDLCERFGV